MGGPKDWGQNKELPCKILNNLPRDYVADIKTFPNPDFFFAEPEEIEFWSAIVAVKGCLHGGIIDLLDCEGVVLDACEEAWEEVDPDERIREISGIGNTMGAVDEDCIGGALHLVARSKRVWFPLANFRGPNDDVTSGLIQRFSILYCTDESGSATDFKVVMTAWRH